MALMGTLFDDFNDNSMSAVKWRVGNYNGAATAGVSVSEIRNRLEIAPNEVGGDYSGYLSVDAYDMTGSHMFVRATHVLKDAAGPEQEMSFHASWDNVVGIMFADGDLMMFKTVAGTRTFVATLVYNPIDHAWWRVRESGGTTYWDTAPATASNPPTEAQWVNRHFEANPITLTSVWAWIGGGTWGATVSPGIAVFDGFNCATALSPTAVTEEFWGMHLQASIDEPWPLVPFKTQRMWDSWPEISWKDINTADGVYDWTNMDAHVAQSVANGVDLIYTFGYAPTWATGATIQDCPTDAAWTNFVTAMVNRYGDRIKYWEIWNEPNEAIFWVGTTAQMVHLAELAAPIIRGTAGCFVLSPAPQGSSAYTWIDGFLAAGGGPHFDILSFHSYTFEAPETLIEDVANMRHVMGVHNLHSVRLWDTEGSWGDDTWPFGTSDDLKKAYLGRFKALSISLELDRSVWYAYESFDWGKLADRTTDALYPAGEAYLELYDWLATCNAYPHTVDGTVYKMRISRDGGYEGILVWDTAGTSSLTVPAGMSSYRTMEGVSTASLAGSSVNIGTKPILLESTVIEDVVSSPFSVIWGRRGRR